MNQAIKKTSVAGMQLIQRFESCRLTAYRDVGGVITIGWGHTGPGVTGGQTIDQAQADLLLSQDLVRFEQTVNSIWPGISQNQFDACVSLSYNIGVEAFKTSTLALLLKGGLVVATAHEFLKWDKVGSISVLGLTRRRAAETVMFLG